jgi:hypothetical protein
MTKWACFKGKFVSVFCFSTYGNFIMDLKKIDYSYIVIIIGIAVCVYKYGVIPTLLTFGVLALIGIGIGLILRK